MLFLISLANTAEPLFLVNRSGNRPLQEQADVYLDKAVDLCRGTGFRKMLLPGDTKFTQTKHLDRWDVAGDVRFIFGYEAHDSLNALADDHASRGVQLPGTCDRALPRFRPHHFNTTRTEQAGDRPAARVRDDPRCSRR